AAAPRQLGEICDLVTAAIARWPAGAASELANPVGAHLSAALAEGCARRADDGRAVRFAATR
ncbi:MAG TPA: hypothetical protein VMD59_01225, partial [Acidimicrobiales bacterium]|nr:hypothetical protein [Acidimicrobiales bacterium]